MIKEFMFPAEKIQKRRDMKKRIIDECLRSREIKPTTEKATIPSHDEKILENAGGYIFEGQKPIGRRDFLVSIAAVAGAWALDKFGTLEKAANALTLTKNDLSEKKVEATESVENSKDEIEEIDPSDAESELSGIEEDEAQPIKFNLDTPIKIDLETMAKAKNHWKERYLNGDLRKDFEAGMKRIEPLTPKLKDIFERNDVPGDLIYISIVESFFNSNKVSKAGAAGPFQFMPKTAKDYGLKINKWYDGRKFPLESGNAAAKLLKDLYGASRNWDMALSGYNWGKFWKYPKLGGDYTLENYVKYFSEKGDRIRRSIKYSPSLQRKVVKGDSLHKIAKLYNIDVKKLKTVNKKKSNAIKEGEILMIPLLNKKQREHVFKMEISGYQENFNYIPKVRAVLEAVKEYS